MTTQPTRLLPKAILRDGHRRLSIHPQTFAHAATVGATTPPPDGQPRATPEDDPRHG